MNPPKRGTPDFMLLLLTFALVAFGLLMVFSASSMTSVYQHDGDPLYYTKRQAIFIALGLIGMLVFMNVPYAKLRKWVVPLFVGILLLLFLVAIIGTGPEGSGIRSWFRFGPFSLQPAEFAKLIIIMYLALIISKKSDRMSEFKHGLLPPLIIVIVVAGLIMLQPDLGTCLVLVATSAVVILVGGARWLHLMTLAASGIALLLVTVFTGGGYRLARFTTFMNPLDDPLHEGYQLSRSLYAFGHGGISGAGFGQSILKLQYLPEAHNDFIFAIIGEELGLIGSALFIIVYSIFVWRGIIVAIRCKDPFGMLLGIGIIGMFGVQAMINIGGVTSSIPLTGVTLPFISYGGSSILVCLASIGILLGISREQNIPAVDNKKRA